jgi:hypothetical protein
MDSSRNSPILEDHYTQIVDACARVKTLVQEHVELELESERHFFGVQTEICRLFRDASNIISDRIDGFFNREQLQSCAWTQTETVVDGNLFPHAAATGSISLSKLKKVKKTIVTEDPRHAVMSPVHPEERQLLESPEPCAANQCEYV